jgi:membrane-associated phospholipid phosphatase
MFTTKTGRRACGALLILGTTLALPGAGLAQPRQGAQPHPGSWPTWVLASANQFRLPPPPDAAATHAELGQLRAMAALREAATLERIAWWNAAAPSYRWNEIALAEALRAGVPVNLASRHLALLHTALADGMAAAWDSKRTHNRPRPGAADPALRPAIAVPASPSYPDEHAVAAGVAAAVLAEIFPRRAEEFARLAEEAGHLRLVAGVAHPSDVAAGATLGRQVAAAALERARRDGTEQRWTGTVPAAPGQWSGTNPALPQAAGWTPWLLSSAAEVRPPPPPAPESPERAAELAQLRSIERTPLSNARALFWEAAAGGLRSHEYWNNHLGRLLFEHGGAADAPRAATHTRCSTPPCSTPASPAGTPSMPTGQPGQPSSTPGSGRSLPRPATPATPRRTPASPQRPQGCWATSSRATPGPWRRWRARPGSRGSGPESTRRAT